MSDDVMWRRLQYFLSPQLDIYRYIAPRVAGLSVMDVGFGTGFGTLQLYKTAAETVGIEVDMAAVEFAAKTLPGSWCWGDITRNIPWHNKFDAVVMIEVLEHISDWETALTHVRAALKDGGRLFISARNANADLRKNELHEREWTAEQFSNSLSKFFDRVALYDYTLTAVQDKATHQTPLVAVATKMPGNPDGVATVTTEVHSLV